MCTCWWCSGQLIWDSDFDASDYHCDEEIEGIVTFLHCSQCEALVTYESPESWQHDA